MSEPSGWNIYGGSTFTEHIPNRPWWRDHLAFACTLAWLGAALGALAGEGVAWDLAAQHLVSPDNPVARVVTGFGGATLGSLAALLAVRRAGRHRRGRLAAFGLAKGKR